MKKYVAFLLVTVLLACAGMSALAVDGTELAVQMVDQSAELVQVSTRRCSFKCTYVNNSTEKAVAGIDLAYVALDSDRNVSMEETTQYLELPIEPQDTRPSPLIYITNQSELAYLIIAVQTVYFADGSSETIDFTNGENYDPAYFRVI